MLTIHQSCPIETLHLAAAARPRRGLAAGGASLFFLLDAAFAPCSFSSSEESSLGVDTPSPSVSLSLSTLSVFPLLLVPSLLLSLLSVSGSVSESSFGLGIPTWRTCFPRQHACPM